VAISKSKEDLYSWAIQNDALKGQQECGSVVTCGMGWLKAKNLMDLARLTAVIERGVDSSTVTRANYCSRVALSTSIS
jgi:hypothetical protein